MSVTSRLDISISYVFVGRLGPDRRHRLQLGHSTHADLGPVFHHVAEVAPVRTGGSQCTGVITRYALVDGTAEQRASQRVPGLHEEGRRASLLGVGAGTSGGWSIGRAH